MKLCIIGGGSVRTPRLIPSLVQRAARLGLNELWLMDNDAERLALIGGLCQRQAEQLGAQFRVVTSGDARAAITDASHVITAIRPGLEAGRAADERIAFELGVLGQETTGAAGFAMAMRSAPAILGYARLVEELAQPRRLALQLHQSRRSGGPGAARCRRGARRRDMRQRQQGAQKKSVVSCAFPRRGCATKSMASTISPGRAACASTTNPGEPGEEVLPAPARRRGLRAGHAFKDVCAWFARCRGAVSSTSICIITIIVTRRWVVCCRWRRRGVSRCCA